MPCRRRIRAAFVGSLDPRIHRQRIRLLRGIEENYSPTFIAEGRYLHEMADVYRKSRIVFNQSVRNDLNMRVFEGMAAGALMVTDAIRRNGLEDLFTAGETLVTYVSEASFSRSSIITSRTSRSGGPSRSAGERWGAASRHVRAARAPVDADVSGRSARPADGAEGAPLDALERVPPGGGRARNRMAAHVVAALRGGGPTVTRDIVLTTKPRPACYLCGREGLALHDGLQDRLFNVAGEWSLRQCPEQSGRAIWLI